MVVLIKLFTDESLMYSYSSYDWFNFICSIIYNMPLHIYNVIIRPYLLVNFHIRYHIKLIKYWYGRLKLIILSYESFSYFLNMIYKYIIIFCDYISLYSNQWIFSTSAKKRWILLEIIKVVNYVYHYIIYKFKIDFPIYAETFNILYIWGNFITNFLCVCNFFLLIFGILYVIFIIINIIFIIYKKCKSYFKKK